MNYNYEKITQGATLIGNVAGVYYYEHPVHGDESTLIAVSHKVKRAISTELWELPDVVESLFYLADLEG
jgi:hypothetical protein